MDEPNPFKDIRRVVRSPENGGKWKAYAEDGSHLLDLDLKALRHLASVSDADIEAEIEGRQGLVDILFVREGMVLVFEGFEVWKSDGSITIEPIDHHGIEVNQHGVRSKIGLPLTINVGSQGKLEFDGVELNRVLLEELMELREKVRKLEKRLEAIAL